jgi:hypothetical protein
MSLYSQTPKNKRRGPPRPELTEEQRQEVRLDVATVRIALSRLALGQRGV